MSAAPGGLRAVGMATRRVAAVATLALSLLVVPAAALAQGGPDVPAESAIVIDASSGDVIASEDAGERRPIASATKLMTALLALERVRPGEVLTAARYEPAPVESQVGLADGERMSVRDLLVALLLESANDAAVTLAHGVEGSTEAFVAEMNARAAELGLDGTSYANPIGFDHPQNYSTAADLAALARRLMGDSRFRDIVEEPSIELRTGARPRVVENRNELVDSALVDGIKTGSTAAAGEVLVGSASEGDVRVISVVLGAPSEAARDRATLTLLRHGLDRFERRRVVAAGERLAQAPVAGLDDELVPLVAEEGVAVSVLPEQRVATRLDRPDSLDGPLPAGEVVGSAAVVREGEVVERVDLLTGGPVPSPDFATRVMDTLEEPVALAAIAVILTGAAALVVARARRRNPGTAG